MWTGGSRIEEGASEIKLTTGTQAIQGANVYIKATGNIGAVITP